MEHLHNGFTLELSSGAFPLSTDSIALAHFAAESRFDRYLDLGSGCGTLGLMLCAEKADCTVTGIELDMDAHSMALSNADANGISSRLTSICADTNNIRDFIPAGSYPCCVSNPPYFSAGPASKTAINARRQDYCTTDQLFAAAAWAVKYGGDFYLVHRPECLGELFIAAGNHGFEPKRLRLLRHKQNGPVCLVLIQCRKGGKPGLKWDEFSLYDSTGGQTAYYRALYHCQEVNL